MDGLMHQQPEAAQDAPASATTPSTSSDIVAAFAPLSEPERARSGPGSRSPDIREPVMPAPVEPPAASALRWKGATASHVWTYRDDAARPLFAVARFSKPDGKDTLPLWYGRRQWTDSAGKKRDVTGWHYGAPPAPRPLYGLDRLAARPDAPVVVVEGEKSADAASVLFPQHVVVTSQGGARAAGKADWSVLTGKNVTIWPDNDDAGASYAADGARLLKAAGAASVSMVDVPESWPAGWDVADPLPPGVTAATLAGMLADAVPATSVELPVGFYLAKGGLWFQPAQTKTNPEPSPVWVCGRVSVIGEARDGGGNDWSLVLRWQDRDDRTHTWCCNKSTVHAPGAAISEALEGGGLSCGSTGEAHSLLKYFVGAVRAPKRLLSASQCGWHDFSGRPAFVLPGGDAFGPAARDVILASPAAAQDRAFTPGGSLGDWQQHVGRLAVGNDRLTFANSVAFAAPLLDLTDMPSGGFHFVGKSQSGKTTLLRCAASVNGRASTQAQIKSWRATSNGLEGTAERYSDLLLLIDELGQADSREVSQSIYMWGNESGKSRAGRDGGARPVRTWRILIVSSGEITIESKMAEAGQRPMAGQGVRFVCLPADAGAGMGVFQHLHEFATPRALAEHLGRASKIYYGTALRAFLARLAAERGQDADALRDRLLRQVEAFLGHVPAGADPQVVSVARRFGLVAAAGELARAYGIVPWPEGEATRAAGACFAAWLAERGGSGAGEDARAIRQVRSFLELHGSSRFEQIGKAAEPDDSSQTKTINRAGFRQWHDGEWQFLVLPEAWRNEVCRGIDPTQAAEVLARAGYLLPSGEKGRRRLDSTVRIKGHGVVRCYRLTAGLIAGADDDDDVEHPEAATPAEAWEAEI
jgi:putative DNA primase/helicase